MEGGGGELRGVIPRASEQVFAAAADLARLGWSFEFHASCLEIYNEELRDLLPSEKGEKKEKLKISDTPSQGVAVPGLRAVPVTDVAQLHQLLANAAKVRSTAATRCNEHSSRSHYVFRMTISGRHSGGGEGSVINGELNLIDLAGSERTKDSGVTGDAMREAQAINKSLSSLGDVRTPPSPAHTRALTLSLTRIRIVVTCALVRRAHPPVSDHQVAGATRIGPSGRRCHPYRTMRSPVPPVHAATATRCRHSCTAAVLLLLAAAAGRCCWPLLLCHCGRATVAVPLLLLPTARVSRSHTGDRCDGRPQSEGGQRAVPQLEADAPAQERPLGIGQDAHVCQREPHSAPGEPLVAALRRQGQRNRGRQAQVSGTRVVRGGGAGVSREAVLTSGVRPVAAHAPCGPYSMWRLAAWHMEGGLGGGRVMWACGWLERCAFARARTRTFQGR
jgi:hypothetical protein